ncbi:MAG: type II toxin-antitoxin system Phd/YefM family antitoxin [Candidatus Binataceae bacterium]
MEASVRELKRQLSRYLRRVAAGEDVTVTLRGRPIARLVRVAPDLAEREPRAAEVRRRLAAIPGVIMPTGSKPRGAKRPIPIRKGEKTLGQIVLEERW